MLRKLTNRMRRAFRSDEGFTLMELMVVILIIAILAGGGLVSYNAFIQRAVNGVATAAAGTLATVVRLYEIENRESLADLDKTAVENELDDYSEVKLTVLASNEGEPAATPEDQMWVKCPTTGTKTWTVWVSRKNRLGKATFDATENATATDKCAAGTPTP